MNRWAVYEYMKHTYMQTGIIPTAEMVTARFRETGPEEIVQGILEFVAVVDAGNIGVSAK